MKQSKLLTNELVTRSSRYTFFKHLGLLPNPDKIISSAGRSYETYRDLKNDPHVWSCIQSRKAGSCGLEYEFENTSDNRIINSLESLNLRAVFENILEACLFGFQVIEIIWEFQDNILLPIELVPKPQEWFGFDVENNLLLKTTNSLKGETLPYAKVLLITHESDYLNPYGTALLGKCYWSVTFKNGSMRFWVNFMERFGMPVLIGKYKRGATQEETNKLAEVLAGMTEDSVIVTPVDIDIEFKEPMRASSVNLYRDMIKMCNSEISKAILSQTLTTELDTGSYAATQTHYEIRKEVIQSDIRLIENTINQLINYIYDLNDLDKNKMLRFNMKTSRAAD